MVFGLPNLFERLKRTPKKTIEDRLAKLIMNERENLSGHDNQEKALELLLKYKGKLVKGLVITKEDVKQEVIRLESNRPGNNLSGNDINDIREILEKFTDEEYLKLMQ